MRALKGRVSSDLLCEVTDSSAIGMGVHPTCHCFSKFVSYVD